MYQLEDSQVETISTLLIKAGINYSHLFDDLLDHICCEIEEQMEQGISFEIAYNKIKDKIGNNRLVEIQEATIFYVKLNLRIMKKVMNVLSVSGLIFLTAGLVFKLMHWPGGGILYFSAFLLFILGFFPIALLNVRKTLSASFFSKDFAIYLVGFFALSETVIAILFSTMHWPGGNYLALISWFLMILVFFPMLFIRIYKSETNKAVNLVLAVFAFLFMGSSIVTSYNRNTSSVNIMEYESNSNDLAYYRSSIQKEVLKLSSEQLSQLAELNVMSDKIESYVLKTQGLILNGKSSIYEVSRTYFRSSTVTPDYNNGFRTLKQDLDKFSKIALSHCDENESLQKLIETKLTTTPVKYAPNRQMSWEQRNFWGQIDLINIYSSLQRILKDIYQIRYEIIRKESTSIAPEH